MKRKIIAVITMCLMTVCMIPSICFAAEPEIEVTIPEVAVDNAIPTKENSTVSVTYTGTRQQSTALMSTEWQRDGVSFDGPKFVSGHAYTLIMKFSAVGDSNLFIGPTVPVKIIEQGKTGSETLDGTVSPDGRTLTVRRSWDTGDIGDQSETVHYSIIKGADQTSVKGSKKDIEIVCDGPFEDYSTIALTKDGETVSLAKGEQSSKVAEGTKVTITSEDLDKLLAGKYTVDFMYENNGVANTTLTVTDETPGNTLAFEKSEYTYIKGTKKDLTLVCNGNLDEFTDFAIAINGSENSTALEKDVDYTTKSGSTVITVKYETLEKIELGKHKALAFYGDNLASATLNVKAAGSSDSNPKTGDNSIALPIMVVLMLAAAAAGTTIYRKNN